MSASGELRGCDGEGDDAQFTLHLVALVGELEIAPG